MQWVIKKNLETNEIHNTIQYMAKWACNNFDVPWVLRNSEGKPGVQSKKEGDDDEDNKTGGENIGNQGYDDNNGKNEDERNEEEKDNTQKDDKPTMFTEAAWQNNKEKELAEQHQQHHIP